MQNDFRLARSSMLPLLNCWSSASRVIWRAAFGIWAPVDLGRTACQAASKPSKTSFDTLEMMLAADSMVSDTDGATSSTPSRLTGNGAIVNTLPRPRRIDRDAERRDVQDDGLEMRPEVAEQILEHLVVEDPQQAQRRPFAKIRMRFHGPARGVERFGIEVALSPHQNTMSSSDSMPMSACLPSSKVTDTRERSANGSPRSDNTRSRPMARIASGT